MIITKLCQFKHNNWNFWVFSNQTQKFWQILIKKNNKFCQKLKKVDLFQTKNQNLNKFRSIKPKLCPFKPKNWIFWIFPNFDLKTPKCWQKMTLNIKTDRTQMNESITEWIREMKWINYTPGKKMDVVADSIAIGWTQQRQIMQQLRYSYFTRLVS